MQAARALIAEGPAPRRRRKSALPWILVGSAAVHLLVLAGLATGVHLMPPMVEPPTITMELQRPAAPPATIPSRPEPSPPTRKPPVIRAAAPALSPAPAPGSTVAPTTSVTAPPGFKAQGLTGGGDSLRQAARDGVGCRNADALALTKAERAVCAETLGEKNKNGPALYAVIDPAKKAAFDKVCKKDDDWCLYRTGKGPYPGLLGLGKKKKRDDW